MGARLVGPQNTGRISHPRPKTTSLAPSRLPVTSWKQQTASASHEPGQDGTHWLPPPGAQCTVSRTAQQPQADTTTVEPMARVDQTWWPVVDEIVLQALGSVCSSSAAAS